MTTLEDMVRAEASQMPACNAVIVETDELTKKRNWQQRLSALAAFLLDNDLRQNGVGEIIAVLRIIKVHGVEEHAFGGIGEYYFPGKAAIGGL